MMNVIECQGLTKSYGQVNALKNISFAIHENKMTGLIGRNGAGKTTLLKIVAGFYRKTSGNLSVFSEDPFNSLKVSSNMIFIDDNLTFPPSLNLSEILTSAGSFYENWDEDLANRLFDYFSFLPKQTHQGLSKGMKSAFNMIIGLSARCPLTIFDEPTTGMDAAVRKDFYRALLKDYLQHPRTIILSSHLLNEIEDILEDILLINNGNDVLHMAVDDLKEFAVGLSGPKPLIDDLANRLEVIHREQLGTQSYIVVRNDFTDSIKKQIQVSEIELSPIATDDLCVYLTRKTKGGIDDVFNRG
jgi:ABC-2 type transport system ATP-binding protein